MRPLLVVLLFFLLLLPLFGDNILGEMAGILQLESEEGTSQVLINLEDLAGVIYLYDNPFVQGVELFFTLSSAAMNFPNSFALYLYRSLIPEPESKITSYRGNQFYMQILPFQSEFSVKIPFEPSNNLKKDATSVVTSPISKNDFPIMMTLLPIMKGLPAEAKSAGIYMKARPLYKNLGGLKIDLVMGAGIEEKDIIVRIDDKDVIWPQEYYSLGPGFHRVTISHALSGSKEFNIAVEKGKTTGIRHTLEAEPPHIIFELNKGLTYFIDGVELSEASLEGPLEISPGIHLLEIKLNESLTLKREYEFKAGENITISLDAQILIENY